MLPKQDGQKDLKHWNRGLAGFFWGFATVVGVPCPLTGQKQGLYALSLRFFSQTTRPLWFSSISLSISPFSRTFLLQCASSRMSMLWAKSSDAAGTTAHVVLQLMWAASCNIWSLRSTAAVLIAHNGVNCEKRARFPVTRTIRMGSRCCIWWYKNHLRIFTIHRFWWVRAKKPRWPGILMFTVCPVGVTQSEFVSQGETLPETHSCP